MRRSRLVGRLESMEPHELLVAVGFALDAFLLIAIGFALGRLVAQLGG